MTPEITLERFVAPLAAERFFEDHWRRGRPHLSAPDNTLAELVRGVDGLGDVEALLARHEGEVSLFGPNGFRSVTSAKYAHGFLREGFNLYITGVEQTLPGARELFAGVARGLGVAPWQVFVEAFAGVAGGVSSRHYDHDVNFQLLLAGDKEWLLEENRNVRNPRHPFHPRRDRSGRWVGFREEGVADDPAIAMRFDAARAERVHAGAGSVLFVPRGHWHETRSLTATWGVNLVIKGQSWAALVGAAIGEWLEREPRFRAYCDGLGYGDEALPASLAAERDAAFEAAKGAAAAVLSELSFADAALAAGSRGLFRWHAAAEAREVVHHGGAWLLRVPELLDAALELDEDVAQAVSKLCRLRHAFSWMDVRMLLAEAGPILAHNLVEELVREGLLVAVAG